MLDEGAVFQTTNDSEVMINLIARYSHLNLVEATARVMAEMEGGFAVVLMDRRRILALRDANGVRPLVIGTLVGSVVAAVWWDPSWDQIAWMWGGLGIGAAASCAVYIFYAADSDYEDYIHRGMIFQGVASTIGMALGGIFGFPLDRCAKIMLTAVAEYLKGETSIKEVTFCLFDAKAYNTFVNEMERL